VAHFRYPALASISGFEQFLEQFFRARSNWVQSAIAGTAQ
jgi:hypothetical protein